MSGSLSFVDMGMEKLRSKSHTNADRGEIRRLPSGRAAIFATARLARVHKVHRLPACGDVARREGAVVHRQGGVRLLEPRGASWLTAHPAVVNYGPVRSRPRTLP